MKPATEASPQGRACALVVLTHELLGGVGCLMVLGSPLVGFIPGLHMEQTFVLGAVLAYSGRGWVRWNMARIRAVEEEQRGR